MSYKIRDETYAKEGEDVEFIYHPLVSSGLSEKKRQVSLSDPSYIPMGTEQADHGSIRQAISFVMNQLSPYSSRFVMYPYPFNTTTTSMNFSEGAIISTTTDFTNAVGFEYLANQSTIVLQQAKAMYDINIAILQLQENYNATSFDEYTYDAYSYCPPLYNWISQKYIQCWIGSDYIHYIESTPDREATSVVYVDEVDIMNGILFNNLVPRFGVLIIPDIEEGVASDIISLLTPAGVEAIQAYVAQGGVIFSSGKGAYVVEKLGYFTTGTFNPNLLLTSQSGAPIKGCNTKTTNNDTNWVRSALCFGPPRDTTGKISAAVLSAPIVNTQLLYKNQTVIATWDPSTEALLSKDQNGILSSISSSANTELYPYIIHSRALKGQVIVCLGSPVSAESQFPWFYNVLFYAMSKPMILDSTLLSQYRSIPALEQVSLSISLTLTNLYSENLAQVSYTVYIAEGIEVVDPLPSNCYLNTTNVVVPHPSLSSNYSWQCTPPSQTIPAFATQTDTFKLYIWDNIITQIQTGIVLLYPLVNYTIPSLNNLEVTLNYGPVTVDAYMAALISTDINADPMGIYPVVGLGNYVDNVQWAENKQDTVALNVYHISVIPLVTPLVDGSNQAEVIHTLEFDYNYYLKSSNGVANYVYPFVNYKPTRDYDNIDWQRFFVRSDQVVVDWDTPVLATKNVRETSIYGSTLNPNITGANIANSQATTSVNAMEVLNQQYFPDADNFFELASQRLQAYLDTTDPSAFATYNLNTTWGSFYNGVAPSWKLMGNSTKRAMKSNLIFLRQDVYWYQDIASEIPIPVGIQDFDTVFSIDRYASNQKTCGGSNVGTPVVPGYYNYTIPARGDDPPGLKANEYTNQLKTDCNHSKAWIDPGAPGVQLPSGVSLGHYIVRLSDNSEVQGGNDAMYFVQDPSALDTEWYYDPDGAQGLTKPTFGTYKEVKIKFLWGSDFQIDPNQSHKGGRITIQLPKGIGFKVADPVAAGAITYSADEVAIVNNVYNPQANTIVTLYNRGNMPDESDGKNSSMQLNLEYLNASAPFLATTTFEEMFYDISAPDNPVPYQRYEVSSVVEMPFVQYLVLSLPALVMKYTLQRSNNATGLNGSYILPLENIQPFVRQGCFIQELKAHRTVYASVENHPVRDTGIVGNTGGFSWITNIGESSIPFREYLTTGAKQMIPAAPITSHMAWTDIWGRVWAQPIRSVFADVAPLPGPLRNFMMTTTYELLRPDTNERVLQWQSDEPLIARVQVKLLNNYYKFFDITGCVANSIVEVTPSSHSISKTDSNQWIAVTGYEAAYGSCLEEAGTILEATLLSAHVRSLIGNATYCSEQKEYYVGCDQLVSIPHLIRRINSTATVWNFAPEVYAHYPDNYIGPTMWDLTHDDYDDSVYTKAYDYHFDNLVPNSDSGIIRPHNIIAFPIYKGLGYSISYSSNLSHPNFPNKFGWWSDNLQNRDETLLAGQTNSNNISVGSADLTTSVGWVNLEDLTAASSEAASKMQNIYVCEFNRKRIQVNPQNPILSFPTNVNINNVVPIDPTLDQDDPRLTSYACNLSSPMYTTEDISQFPNYLATYTPRDWLYFASNLRGEAKETINILYTVQPLASSSNSGVEGVTEVQDGGSFVYWNPSLGPNCFEIVDDPTNSVIATRTDLLITQEVYPTSIPTFDAVVIHDIHMEDPAEIGRQWTLSVYTNNYGYGDSTVTVFVGGATGSTAILLPGDTTQISITFYNNAGFDWNLLQSAFPMEDFGVKAINAMDLASNLKHTIQVPTQYNFMTVNIPEEWIPYVTIVPSDLFADTAPMEFDFTSNNVMTIRDGFQGDYYYKLTISSNLPDSLKGRIHTFPVTLNSEYFDQLPGPNDPTGIHDYTIEIPPIVFGVPFTSGPNAGKIFYTSGHAHNLTLAILLNPLFTPVGAQFVDSANWIDQLDVAASNPDGRLNALKSFWSNFTEYNNDSCSFSVQNVGGSNLVVFNLTKKGIQFPFPTEAGPEIASIEILLYTTAQTISPGWIYPTNGAYVNFTDDVGKNKSAAQPIPLVIRASGAYLSLVFVAQLYDLNLQRCETSILHNGQSGYIQANVSITNIGTDLAYRVKFWFKLGDGLEWPADKNNVDAILGNNENGFIHNLTVNTDYNLPPNELLTIPLTFQFQPLTTNKRSIESAPTSRTFITTVTGIIDLTPTPGELTVNQTLPNSFIVPISTTSLPVVTLSATSRLEYQAALTLDTTQLGSTATQSSTAYIWGRRNVNFGTTSGPQGQWYLLGKTSTPSLLDDVGKDVSGVVPQVDYLVSVISTTTNVAYTQSNVYNYRPDSAAGAIVGIIIGILAILLCLFLLIFLFLRYKKKHPEKFMRRRRVRREVVKTPEKPSPNNPYKPPSKTPETDPQQPNPPDTITRTGSAPVVRHKTVNIDYLMTGARRVTVKDGNPTAKVVEEVPVDIVESKDSLPEVMYVEEEVFEEMSSCQWLASICCCCCCKT